MIWISTNDALPPIDEAGNKGRDGFKTRSIRVLVKCERGFLWARYWYNFQEWEIEGLGYSLPIEWWIDIKDPE